MSPLLRRVLRRLWPAPPEELGVREAYARLADGYRPEAHNPFMQLEQATMLALLPDVAGKTALDLACGTGRYLQILRAHGAARIMGIDLVARDAAAGAGPGAARARGFCGRCPSPTRASTSSPRAWRSATSPISAAAVAEMARVLRPGGALLYSDFHPSARLAGHARSFTVGGRAFTVEHHLHLPEAHRAACGAVGLEIEEMRDGLSATRPPFAAVLAIRARRRR